MKDKIYIYCLKEIAMEKDKDKGEQLLCPVGRFFADLESRFGGKSEFFKHMNSSRMEFLKGIRSLVDERIESLEKKGAEKKERKSAKIKVE